MGAHGGAGTSLLTAMSRYAHDDAAARLQEHGDPGNGPWWLATDAGTAWPIPEQEQTDLVVMVCTTTMWGLEWARDVALQHLSGHSPQGTTLLGLVSIGDQPAKLTPSLSTSRRLLDGLYAHHWKVPYIPEYRLIRHAQPDRPVLHPALENTFHQIRSTILKGL